MSPVLIILGSSGLEVLFPFEEKGEGISIRETEKFSQNQTLHVPPGHLEILTSEDQKAKKGVTTLAGTIYLDYHEDLGLLLPIGSWKNRTKTQGIHRDDF